MKIEYTKVKFGDLITSERFTIREDLKPAKVTRFGDAKSSSKPADPENISKLAESIQKIGLLQNLVVRPVKGKYEVVSGHRRYFALLQANTSSDELIPVAIIRDKNVQLSDLFEVSLTENLQRNRISAAEFANTFIHFVLKEKIGRMAIPDYPESVSDDLIIQGLWFLHYSLDPTVNIKPPSSSFLKFVRVLQQVLISGLNAINFSHIDFLTKVFPVVADKELGEAVKRGEISLNDVAVLSKVNVVKHLEVKEEKVNEEDKDRKEDVHRLVKELSDDEKKEALRKQAVKAFKRRYSREDWDNKPFIRKKAEELGITRDDLNARRIKIQKKEIKSNSNVTVDEDEEKIIEESVNQLIGESGDFNPDAVVFAAQDTDTLKVLEEFEHTSPPDRAIIFDLIVRSLEQDKSQRGAVDEYVVKAQSDALERFMEFVGDMVLHNRMEQLSEEEKRKRVEEITQQTAYMELLGTLFKYFGEALISLSKNLPEEGKKEMRSEVYRNSVLVSIIKAVRRMVKREGEIL